MEILPESGWEGLVRELLRHKGAAILIGASDTGKSTLARYLLQKLLKKSVSVCLVDADVGQSSLGPPAAITARIFRKPGDVRYFRPDAMFFIGTVNPSKSISRMVRGAGKMAGFCARGRADITLVDTTGLISGRAGRALKLGKVRLLKPGHIIAIEKKDELEHILSALGPDGFRVHRLKPSVLARATGTKERASYRRERLKSYFRNSKIIKFLFARTSFERLGRPFDFTGGGVRPGLLLGLGRGEETLCLGVLMEWDAAGVLVMTPLGLSRARRVDHISIGEITVEGVEAERNLIIPAPVR